MDSAKHKIKVLVVDDHPVVREGVCSWLATCANMTVLGEASNGPDAIRKARQLSPDVIVLDIQMPGMDGLEVTKVLAKESPRSKVLIFSVSDNSYHVKGLLKAGARGYALKAAPPEELVRAIEIVSAGQIFISPSAGQKAVGTFNKADGSNPLSRLTDREREVVALLANGKTNKQIAHVLGIGVRTVETHREKIMRKLGIRSVAPLTKMAVAQGLISLDDKL